VVKKTSRNGFEGMGEKKDGSYIERDKHSIHRRPEQEEGFITVDREEKITYINKTLCKKLGYSQMQLIGESIRKVTVEKEFKRISELTSKRQDGLASSYIIELITHGGNSILFRVSAAPLYSGEDFLGTMGIFSDITREKADLDSIIETIQYQELMVQYLPTGLLILASDGIIINSNPAFTKITGIDGEELRNRHILNLGFLENLSYRYLLDNLLRFQVNFDHETDLIKMENGVSLYLHLRGHHLELDNGISYYLLVLENISDRKRSELTLKKKMADLVILEKQLQDQILLQKQELREKEWQLLEQHRAESNKILLAKIAHFWRQPLNNATVLIQSIEDDYNYDELNQESFSSKVNKAVTQLADLSKTLETFRYLSGDDLEESEFDVKKAVTQAVELVKPSYQNCNMIINLNLEEGIYATGYPKRLSQALVNIIDNSMQAFQERKIENPNSSIELSFEDNSAWIVIGDNAGGIEADIATRIFDPYFTTRNSQAQGLGLYQTKRVILEMFAGTIEYHRTSTGSEFIIRIPLKKNKKY